MRHSIFTVVTAIFLTQGAFAQTAEARYKTGVKLTQNGDFAAALLEFNAINTNAQLSEKQRAMLHYNKGVCFLRTANHAKAISEFSRAARFNNRHFQAFYALGIAYRESENFADAEAALLSAIAINKRDGEAWFDLGLTQIALNKSSNAKLAFQNAVKFGTVAIADAHNNIGVLFYQENNRDAAISEFETAVKIANGEPSTAAENLALINRNQIAALHFSRAGRTNF